MLHIARQGRGDKHCGCEGSVMERYCFRNMVIATGDFTPSGVRPSSKTREAKLDASFNPSHELFNCIKRTLQFPRQNIHAVLYILIKGANWTGPAAGLSAAFISPSR